MTRKHVISPPGFDDGEWPEITIDVKNCSASQKHSPHQWGNYWCEGTFTGRPIRARVRTI